MKIGRSCHFLPEGRTEGIAITLSNAAVQTAFMPRFVVKQRYESSFSRLKSICHDKAPPD
jgi:hypothetical protein